jgi:hypothetical protein
VGAEVVSIECLITLTILTWCSLRSITTGAAALDAKVQSGKSPGFCASGSIPVVPAEAFYEWIGPKRKTHDGEIVGAAKRSFEYGADRSAFRYEL